MYVQDFISALIFIIDNFDKIPVKMNIGLGYDYSVEQYYHFIAEVVGFSGEFKFDLEKPSGMKRKLMDISLQKRLGWSPAYSIQDGLKLTYKHLSNISYGTLSSRRLLG